MDDAFNNVAVAEKPAAGELPSAVQSGDIEKVRGLLQRGADPDEYGPALKDIPLLVMAMIWRSKVEMISLLLEYDANIEIRRGGGYGSTPLIQASINGHTEATVLLIERGASLDAKSTDGKTAMDYAESCNHMGIAEILQSAIDAKAKAEREEQARVKAAEAAREERLRHACVTGRQDILRTHKQKFTLKPA